MKRYFFFLCLLIFAIITNAQVNIDSLWGVWKDESKHDSIRAAALHNISWDGYLYSQPDSAHYFAGILYHYARDRDMKKMMAMALRTQGVSYRLRSNYTMAMDCYMQSLAIYEEISSKKGIAGVLNSIGIIYDYQGQYLKALDYYQRSLNINREISDNRGMARALNNIGIIYDYQANYVKALEYYRESFKIHEEAGYIRGMASALNNIGLVYTKQKEYSSALDKFQQSLALQEQISNNRGIASCLNNIGEVYSYQGNYSKALEYFLRSNAVSEEMMDNRGKVISMNNIGITNNQFGNYQEAISWCKKGYLIARESKMISRQKNACECLYEAYKNIGDDKKALEYHEYTRILDDSLRNEETSKMLQQMEFAKQMLADSLIREENKLKVQMAHEAEVRKKNRSKNIFILSAVFLFVAAAGLYRRIVFVRKAKKVIENAKEKSDNLLLNILPSDIAKELKDKGRAEARHFENVSILFTDFKAFTEISEKLSAEELVSQINSYFKPFDTICQKYKIEKIKTIGDSYMAAGGIPVQRKSSVRDTVMAGIEMAELLVRRKNENIRNGDVYFDMRVGIHTGPAVAGIVGTSKFQYDIWGDTVNIASRMESAGEVGKVNISGDTYNFIEDDAAFRFRSRGKVSVKGKGEIEMWFVERAETPNSGQVRDYRRTE